MLTNLFRINQVFDSSGIFLNLAGPLSQNLMVEMGGLMKTKMKLEGSDPGTIRKAFSILVELNQNIIHYSAEKAPEKKGIQATCHKGCGIISVGKEGDHYFLISGNLVANEKVEKLRGHLNKLVTMTKDELKQAYRQQRRSEPDDDSTGAGLGMIDIARNISKPLEFNFCPVDEVNTFFSLKSVV